MTHGSLFAGIGGFDLGFERAGFKTVWQVEIDEYCRRVLERHFPGAERFADIRDCGKHNLKPVDVISGGFPCQDISNAGLRAGIDGERSGLWNDMQRIVGELCPRFVLVENVAALLVRGAGRVLGDLAALGYDAEWKIIRASDVGAPHRRERVWILAYAESHGCRGLANSGEAEDPTVPRRTFRVLRGWPERAVQLGDGCGDLVNAASGRLALADSNLQPAHGPAISREECNPWTTEPNVGRVAHGVPRRVDRLRALGNAVVPQIAQWIAERIKAVANE